MYNNTAYPCRYLSAQYISTFMNIIKPQIEIMYMDIFQLQANNRYYSRFDKFYSHNNQKEITNYDLFICLYAYC
jgi:hypothetical protein